MDDFTQRIEELSELEDNWNSYGAPSISPAALAALSEFFISPTNNGGVDISWKAEAVSVEFDINGDITAVHWEKQ